jgi:sporulation protein YlmC with PRC-barrel domain
LQISVRNHALSWPQLIDVPPEGKEQEMNIANPATTTPNNTYARLVLSADTLSGDDVYNAKGESLGSIKDIMLDVHSGKVCYAVLALGGFLGMGEKLFAVPWSSLKLNTEKKQFVFDVALDRLKNAPGFDKEQWPNMADPEWEKRIHTYYGV